MNKKLHTIEVKVPLLFLPPTEPTRPTPSCSARYKWTLSNPNRWLHFDAYFVNAQWTEWKKWEKDPWLFFVSQNFWIFTTNYFLTSSEAESVKTTK